MRKSIEIIEIAKKIESNGEVASVEKIAEIAGDKANKNYINKILGSRKKIESKISKENAKCQKIVDIAKSMGENINLVEIKKIAKKNRITFSYSKIRKILLENNMTTNLQEKYADRRKEMAELTRQGWTMAMIGKKFGITRQAVSLLLKKASEKDGVIVVKGLQGKPENPKNSGENCVLVKRRKNLDASIKCEACNKSFCAKKSNRKTCSVECLRKLQRKGGKWSRYEFVELTCKNCGNVFKRSRYIQSITAIRKHTDNHYCGRKCYLDFNSKLSAELIFKQG